jgi:hypothetical protein
VHGDPVEDLDEVVLRDHVPDAIEDEHRDVRLGRQLEHVDDGRHEEVVAHALYRIGDLARRPGGQGGGERVEIRRDIPIGLLIGRRDGCHDAPVRR